MRKFSQIELELWGREVASSFLTSNIPLNAGIIKIARDNQLNYEQIKRVTEEANNVAYLQKFAGTDPKAEDRYIEFEVGDPKVIAASVNAPEKIETPSTDYVLSPKEHSTPSFQVNVSEKVDPIPEPTDTEKSACAYIVMGIKERFETDMNRLQLECNEKIAMLKNEYKLASLDTTRPSPNILTAVLQTYNKQTYEPNSFEQRIANNIIESVKIDKGEKLASVVGVVNIKHPAVKFLSEAVEISQKYAEKYNNGPDLTPLDKVYPRNEKVAELTKQAGNILLKALIAAGLLSATVAGAHKLGYERGKAVQSIIMSPMKQIPQNYNPLGGGK